MDHTELPAAIVAPCLALAQDLAAWSRTHPDQPLAEHDQGVLGIVRAHVSALLAAVVTVTTQELDPALATVGRRCPRCDRRTPVHGERARSVQTVCGPLALRRPWYHCASCHQGFSPVDTTLGIPPRSAQRGAARLGGAGGGHAAVRGSRGAAG